MVSTSLMSLWLEVGGSPIGMVGVVKKIKQLVTKVESFKRTPSWRRKSSKFPRTLFNITSCTCLRGKDWKKNLAVQRCECPSHLSDDAVEFILDQQGPRHMRISNGVFVNAGQAVDLPIAKDIMVKVHANPNESEEDEKFCQSAETLHKVDCSQELDMNIDSNPEKESQSKCYLL